MRKQVDLDINSCILFYIKLILGFTSKQLQRLYTRFQQLEKREPRCGYLTREDLLGIREVALNPLGERLVDVIIQDYGYIICHIIFRINIFIFLGNANRINFRQFANVFAQVRRGKGKSDLNTKEKKLLFLFSVCFTK